LQSLVTPSGTIERADFEINRSNGENPRNDLALQPPYVRYRCLEKSRESDPAPPAPASPTAQTVKEPLLQSLSYVIIFWIIGVSVFRSPCALQSSLRAIVVQMIATEESSSAVHTRFHAAVAPCLPLLRDPRVFTHFCFTLSIARRCRRRSLFFCCALSASLLDRSMVEACFSS